MINLPAELGWISKNLPLGPKKKLKFGDSPPPALWLEGHDVTTAGGSTVVARADNPPNYKDRRQHNFAHVVENNLPVARF